jgi:hypothetical protein
MSFKLVSYYRLYKYYKINIIGNMLPIIIKKLVNY